MKTNFLLPMNTLISLCLYIITIKTPVVDLAHLRESTQPTVENLEKLEKDLRWLNWDVKSLTDFMSSMKLNSDFYHLLEITNAYYNEVPENTNVALTGTIPRNAISYNTNENDIIVYSLSHITTNATQWIKNQMNTSKYFVYRDEYYTIFYKNDSSEVKVYIEEKNLLFHFQYSITNSLNSVALNSFEKLLEVESIYTSIWDWFTEEAFQSSYISIGEHKESITSETDHNSANLPMKPDFSEVVYANKKYDTLQVIIDPITTVNESYPLSYIRPDGAEITAGRIACEGIKFLYDITDGNFVVTWKIYHEKAPSIFLASGTFTVDRYRTRVILKKTILSHVIPKNESMLYLAQNEIVFLLTQAKRLQLSYFYVQFDSSESQNILAFGSKMSYHLKMITTIIPENILKSFSPLFAVQFIDMPKLTIDGKRLQKLKLMVKIVNFYEIETHNEIVSDEESITISIVETLKIRKTNFKYENPTNSNESDIDYNILNANINHEYLYDIQRLEAAYESNFIENLSNYPYTIKLNKNFNPTEKSQHSILIFHRQYDENFLLKAIPFTYNGPWIYKDSEGLSLEIYYAIIPVHAESLVLVGAIQSDDIYLFDMIPFNNLYIMVNLRSPHNKLLFASQDSELLNILQNTLYQYIDVDKSTLYSIGLNSISLVSYTESKNDNITSRIHIYSTYNSTLVCGSDSDSQFPLKIDMSTVNNKYITLSVGPYVYDIIIPDHETVRMIQRKDGNYLQLTSILIYKHSNGGSLNSEFTGCIDMHEQLLSLYQNVNVLIDTREGKTIVLQLLLDDKLLDIEFEDFTAEL